MLGSSIYLALPRRISVVTLLFGMAAVVWILACAMLATQSLVFNTELDTRLTGARRYGIRVQEAAISKSQERLQNTLNSIRSEGSFTYCAFVGPNGIYAAHTEKRQIGKRHEEPTGTAIAWAGLTGTKFTRGGAKVLEYRLPLRDKETRLGSLRLGFTPTPATTLAKRAALFLPLLAITPFMLIVGSSFFVQRMLSPMGDLEQQIKLAASAATVSDVEFSDLPKTSATGAGWSQIIAWLRDADESSGLSSRMSTAMSSLKQERSTDVLNSLGEGVAVTDSEGKVTLANNTLSVLVTGDADSQPLLDQPLVDLLEISNLELDSPLLNKRSESRSTVVEINRPSTDGEQVLRISRNPLRHGESGQGNGHVWCVRDITQQKMKEQARDKFLDSATHELRTPLSNIRAYAETLACMDEIDIESQKMFCNTINSEAARLARFIDDLLSISSMEVGSLSLSMNNCNIERLLGEAVEKVSGQAEQKSIKIETMLPPKYPKMKLDKDKVQIALVNLLGNAIKYTPDDGGVTMRVKVLESVMQIDIEDTGVGISEDELEKVFDKFFRSESAEVQAITGTGLGLSLTQEIIRLHGGDLTLASTLGEGSTFTVTLPLPGKGD